MSDSVLSDNFMTELETDEISVLPLRDVVVYPNLVVPLFVGRDKSIRALELATKTGKEILLVTQKMPDEGDPKVEDLYKAGTIATLLQLLKLPDGTVKVLLEGVERVLVKEFIDTPECLFAKIDSLKAVAKDVHQVDVLSRSVLALFERYAKLSRKILPEILTLLSGIEDTERMIDTIAAHLTLKVEEKQKILETEELSDRLEALLSYLEIEINVLQMEKRIDSRVKRQMEKGQREYVLREKMHAIQKELGEADGMQHEVEELLEKIKKVGLSEEAKEKAEGELKKLKMMAPMSPEATVVRNYLDALLDVPWKKCTKINKDLMRAKEILDNDHDALEKVKERIVEYLAVQSRVKKLKGPILCLVGPPGVGKTSLGRSIARATGRKFVRMSLGGVRDEAEIRGHRRTYIGALPGKIIQNLTKVGVKNPLFLLDEVDKMAVDFRGDPASALLEVLDPEQNYTFNDHYLEVDYDLSDVMFVTTANTLDIPPPLLDRMEVLNLAGYTEDEKMNIAKNHLLKKEIKENGLRKKEIDIADEVIRDIIRYYTREAGVRGLERSIAKICRKVVKKILLNKDIKRIDIRSDNLEDYLGVRRYRFGKAETKNQIGQATGLAWTEVGGELLTVEAVTMPGQGKITITGQLGDVMKESVQAAISVVRNRAKNLRIQPSCFEKNDFHIHVPEGAIPKDGPSAGITMCTALVSVLAGIPILSAVAMTGEITLRGEVLPIGGLKEKLLAARRGGVQYVIIPEENRKDLKEIPDNVKEDLDIRPMRWIEEVLNFALEKSPFGRLKTEGKKRSKKKGVIKGRKKGEK